MKLTIYVRAFGPTMVKAFFRVQGQQLMAGCLELSNEDWDLLKAILVHGITYFQDKEVDLIIEDSHEQGSVSATVESS